MSQLCPRGELRKDSIVTNLLPEDIQYWSFWRWCWSWLQKFCTLCERITATRKKQRDIECGHPKEDCDFHQPLKSSFVVVRGPPPEVIKDCEQRKFALQRATGFKMELSFPKVATEKV